MSGVSAAYGLTNAWGRADYGVSAIRQLHTDNDAPKGGQSGSYAETSGSIKSARVTKRMADGDMVIVDIRNNNIVSTRTFSPTQVNLATHLDYTNDQMRRVNNYRNSLDSISSGSFINVTA